MSEGSKNTSIFCMFPVEGQFNRLHHLSVSCIITVAVRAVVGWHRKQNEYRSYRVKYRGDTMDTAVLKPRKQSQGSKETSYNDTVYGGC